nr:hypothetical protein [Tanacetum cinerariifolium]
MSSSTITYTSISFDPDLPLWGFHSLSNAEPQSPEAAPQSLEQAPPSPDYVPGSGVSEEEDKESSKDDEEEEKAPEQDEEVEHLAPVDFAALPALNLLPLAKETEPFKTDESATTSSPPPRSSKIAILISMTRLRRERKIVRHRPPMAASSEALIAETDIPEVEMTSQKRAWFTDPTCRFEVWESSAAATTIRQTRHVLTSSVDYGFIDNVDTCIRATNGRVMTVVEEDNRALLRAQISLLMRERRYFRSMASAYEREVFYARKAWTHSESRSQAMEAQIRAL